MTLFLTLKLEDETATAALAQKVSRQLQSGDVVFLSGDLGAGKTTFTRHLISAFGLNTKVKSPTYTLLETYDLPETAPAKTLHHFDLYRLTDPREWYSAGFEENINDTAIVVIEWAEKAEGALPKPDWRIHLTHAAQQTSVGPGGIGIGNDDIGAHHRPRREAYAGGATARAKTPAAANAMSFCEVLFIFVLLFVFLESRDSLCH